MKKLSCMLLLGGIITVLSAQSNLVNVTMKENVCLQDGYKSANPAPYTKTHLYMKGQHPKPAGSRNITTVTLGSSGNLFTILSAEVNRVAAHNDLDAVVFVHRSNPAVFPNSNVGQYRYDVSHDGGATWTLNHGVLNPKGNQQTMAGRYPNTVIHNEVNNANPDSAYMLYLGSWLPFDAGGSWDGHFSGVARLDNDTLTFTENVSTPNNGDLNIVGGLCNGAQGVFWAVNWSNASNTELNPDAFLLFKGVWNPNKDDVDWVQHLKVTPPFDKSFDTKAKGTSLNIAFDKTGQYGWLSFLGDATAGGDNVMEPVLYKTTDGGDNWTGPITLDLSTLDNVVSNLVLAPIPQTAFDMDIVVDANGNPHMLVVIGSSGNDYAISTGSNAGLKIYDITYVPGASSDCKWQAILIDNVATFRGDITTQVSEDNRPQCSTSPDGEKIFFGWLDSDANVTGGDNNLPNLKTRALDITTGMATQVVNRTLTDPIWSGAALFASYSPNALHSGSTYRVPTVFTELNPSGSDEDPVNFYYITDNSYQETDFSIDVFPPVITLNGVSPVTVVVNNPYTDQGATANDNNDGDISGNILTDTTNVNTAVVGSYVVTYNVTDSEGNASCEVTRVVNVVANPDNTAPIITLTGASTVEVDVCDFFSDAGATATDNVDGNITGNIVVTSNIPQPLQPGSYTINYDVIDGAGNAAAQVTRTVNVSDLPPTIILNGDSLAEVEVCRSYADPGALAVDNCEGALTVTVTGNLDINTPGIYTRTYTATDGVNPAVSVQRTIEVTPDVTPPTMTLIGANPFLVYLGTAYNDPGAAAFDCVDGNVTSEITLSGSTVNVSVRDTYAIAYNVVDDAGNAALPLPRTVIVNTEPDPNFTFTVSGGSVSFQSTSLYSPTVYEWDFGDGFSSGIMNPTRNYSANGTYNVCLTVSNVFNTLFSKPEKTFCQDVVVTSVGIDEVALSRSFDVYPNPTTGLMTLEIKTSDFEQVRIELLDLVGKSISALELNDRTAGSKYALDFSGSSEGVYLVKIQTEKGTATKKVIVSR